MSNQESLTVHHSFDESEYMSEEMLVYFKSKLLSMRDHLITKEMATSLKLVDEPIGVSTFTNHSSTEEIHDEDFKVQEHEELLRHEIESALQRIHDGTFGFCEETGKEIGVKRLMAVPYARYCIQVQQSKEQEKKRHTAFG